MAAADDTFGMARGSELAAAPRSVLATRLVGRDREQRVLAELVEEAIEGRGGVVFVLGEAGIGKSRLAREAADLADARGLVVVRGRAVEAQTPVAHRPLTEALCSAVRAHGTPDAPELAPFRTVLGRLIPDWRAPEPEVEDSIVTLSEGVLRFLSVLAADRGCVVILEDLHWADPESLGVLEYLADNLTDERVLCVATARVEERSSAVDLARALQARRSIEIVQPLRLTEDEVVEMVRTCLGSDSVPDEVLAFARRSDGVPFLVEELLAVAVASGSLVDDGRTWSLSDEAEAVVPLTFADSIRRRLAVIGDGPRTVLLAAAVLGRRFDWSLLTDMTDLDRRSVLGALRTAVDAQLVSADADDGTFRFRHALSRDAVLSELLPPERAALSARASAALERAHPGLPGESCELAAELAQQAGDPGRAAALLLEVAQRAVAAGALATAEATLDRARLLAPSDDPVVVAVETCLAEVLSVAGKREQAIEVCESLLDRLAGTPASAAARAVVHLGLARADVAAARYGEATSQLDRARAEASAAGDEASLAAVDALAAHAAMGIDRTEDAAALAASALERSQRLGLPQVACEALEILGRCSRPRDLAAAEAAFAEAYAIADEHRLAVWRVRALHELGTIDLLAGRGVARLDETRRMAFDCGALATAAMLDVQIAAGLAVGDDPERAVAVARRSAELANRYHLDDTMATALAFEGLAHARLGRRDALDSCERDAQAATPGSTNLDMVIGLARAVLAFVEEDRAEAVRRLELAASMQAASLGDRASAPISGIWALIAVLDAHPEAEQLAWPEEEPVHFVGRAYLRYARAVLAGRAGQRSVAVALVAEGDELLTDCSWFRQYGRRVVAEASIADGWGAPEGWLREALAFFDGRSDDRIASACRSLLRRAGVAVPRRRSSDVVPPALAALGVTGRELEVLRLLAEGLSNQEIATRLYLSPRTVERHVANLAVKTGTERRAQLVAYAARSADALFGG
jgi:DNA-binding CsgD family transcriptional regulator/tetratricopeptide (TPR) repeat protein